MNTWRRLITNGRKACFSRETFVGIAFDTVKISCLLRDKVTPQKAVWTAARTVPAGSYHVITQRSLPALEPVPSTQPRAVP